MNGFAMHQQQLQPGVVCVEVAGEFDVKTAYAFDEQLQAIESSGVKTVVVDLRGVSFVDSSGLARLIAASRRASQNGHRFALVRGCRAVERLFALTACDMAMEMVSEPGAVLN